MVDETAVGGEWCKDYCPYRSQKNCKLFDSEKDCYVDNNRKYFRESG
jgi:hypothetical protein